MTITIPRAAVRHNKRAEFAYCCLPRVVPSRYRQGQSVRSSDRGNASPSHVTRSFSGATLRANTEPNVSPPVAVEIAQSVPMAAPAMLPLSTAAAQSFDTVKPVFTGVLASASTDLIIPRRHQPAHQPAHGIHCGHQATCSWVRLPGVDLPIHPNQS